MNFSVTWSAFGVLPPDARALRIAVFMREQGFREEFDAVDARSWHAVLRDDTGPVGTARLFWEAPGRARAGRLAIQQGRRTAGCGRYLMDAVCRRAGELGARELIAGAQKRAAGFYEACGFVVCGALYLDEGVPHILMKRDLEAK